MVSIIASKIVANIKLYAFNFKCFANKKVYESVIEPFLTFSRIFGLRKTYIYFGFAETGNPTGKEKLFRESSSDRHEGGKKIVLTASAVEMSDFNLNPFIAF